MKRVVWISIIILLLFSVFGLWYWLTFRMMPAVEFELGDDSAPQSLLIAYQGSTYKHDVIETVVTHFSANDLYIKAIDINQLDQIKTTDWSAIFICHTWEIWQPPKAIEAFHSAHAGLDNCVYLTTSGDGGYHIKGVDAITSASLLSDTKSDADSVIARIDRLLL